MSDYSVVLYIGSNSIRYKVDDLIHRSFNGYLDRDIACTDQKMYFPIVKEEDGYYLEDSHRSWIFRLNGGEPVRQGMGRILLKHGDYLRAEKSGYGYAALFLEDCCYSFYSCVYKTTFDTPVLIGRGDDMNVIVRSSDSVSRRHAEIHKEESGIYIEDISGKNGVYVNGVRTGRQKLLTGDEILIGGVTIIYIGEGLVVPSFVSVRNLVKAESMGVLSVKDPSAQQNGEYIRTPRIYKSLEEGEIEIDPPTQPGKEKEQPFILSAGPSLTMSMVMLVSVGSTISNVVQGGNSGSLVTNGVMAVSMLAGALLWPKLQRSYNSKLRMEEEAHRQRRYQKYIAEKEEKISRLYQHNTQIWNDKLYPAPGALLEMAGERNRRIWERTPEDEDFLSVRLGVGERPFEIAIRTRKKGFVLNEDKLEDKAEELAQKYSTLKDVPMTLSLLSKKTVGVIGDTYAAAKSMILNLAFFHASDEVKIVLVYNRFQEAEYGALAALPHTWSDDKTKRYAATTKEEARVLFSMLDEEIQEREAQSQKNERRIPHYVVMMFDPTLAEDVSFRRYLLGGSDVGVSAVYFGEQFNAIPKECSAVVQVLQEEGRSGVYFKHENHNRFMNYRPDVISEEEYGAFIASMVRLNTKAGRKAVRIPERISFLDTYQVGNIAALGIQNRWNTNTSDRSLAAIVGVRAGNEAFVLDIHEKHHGCHGLVAGTTGSGKSEFLQAYILSMMINFSPNEVGFVLIDFKGGDMARPFLKSPHLAATISNLSENTLYRALVSLEAEVKSRQRKINDAAKQLGVDKLDINSYHRYFKEKRVSEPLPHLIIVIDEFAQLKSQHQEFMAKLIDIAQVGRSLGIHLILATQKPSGVVDPQIWSNSRFKVCLKVTEKQDSLDMINHPEAAMIKLPGRAYVQIGYDEIFEQIQSGYSGADYIAKEKYIEDESITVSMINAPGEKMRSVKDVGAVVSGAKKKTQLEEIVAEICSLGDGQGLRVRQLWLPQLPNELRYERCDEQYPEMDFARCDRLKPGKAICGMMDLPASQIQIPYAIDFLSEGHLAVYGSSGSGTSTFIQTIAYSMALRYSPDWFSLLVLDFDGGSLVNLSGMPHCIGYVTGENEKGIAQALTGVQAIISERRALFAKYNCANYESYIESSGEKLPVLLLILDNYASFRESMYKQEEKLIRIIASARSCGIFAVITGDSKNAIYYRVTDHLANRIAFNMNDSDVYRDVLNVKTPIRPEGSKGRALALYGDGAAEVQIAVPFDSSSEAERNKRTAALYAQMQAVYGENKYRMQFDDDEEEEEYEEAPAKPAGQQQKLAPLPPVSSMERPIRIGSNVRTGAPCGFETAGCQRIFIANPERQDLYAALIGRAAEACSRVYIIGSQTYDLPDGAQRVEDLDQFVSEHFTGDAESDGIYIIDGFTDFYDRISDEALAKLEVFLRRDAAGCFITVDDMKRIRDGYSSTELFIRLVQANSGIVIGGGVDNETVPLLHRQFKEIPFDIRSKKLGKDQGFAYTGLNGAYVRLWS